MHHMLQKPVEKGHRSRSDRDRWEAFYLTKGDLDLHGLLIEKSAEVVVVVETSPDKFGEGSPCSEGLNIKMFQMPQGCNCKPCNKRNREQQECDKKDD